MDITAAKVVEVERFFSPLSAVYKVRWRFKTAEGSFYLVTDEYAAERMRSFLTGDEFALNEELIDSPCRIIIENDIVKEVLLPEEEMLPTKDNYDVT